MANYTIRNLSLLEAVSEISTGALQLPDFQRPFVWRESDRKQLLESMQKGYPVGGLLLLEIPAGQGESSPFGAKPFEDVPNAQNANALLKNLRWLALDGQQRLTSTFMAFSDASTTKKWFFLNLRLLFSDSKSGISLDMEKYIVAKPRPDMPEALLFSHDLLPLTFIGQGRQALRQKLHTYFTNLQAIEGQEEYANFINLELEAYLTNIFDYTFPCVVLPSTLDVEAVANVFTKLNTGGISLGAFDLCVSSMFPKGVKLREMWNGIKDEPNIQMLDKDGTGILQAVALQAGKEVKKSALVKNIDKIAIDAYWDKAVTGFNYAAGHLTAGGFTSRRTVPYDTLAPALAAALMSAPRPTDPPSKNALQMKVERWILQTAFSQRYTEGSDAKKLEDYPAAVDWFNNNVEPRFLEAVTWTENGHHFSATGAKFKGFLGILNKKSPLDLVQNSVRLGLDSGVAQAQAQIHHLFPKAWLKTKGFQKKEIDRALNMTFLTAESNNYISDTPPSVYLSKLLEEWRIVMPDQSQQQLEAKLISLLGDHLIDSDGYKALMSDDYEGFLKARGATLRTYLTSHNVQVAVVENLDAEEDLEEEMESDG